MRFVDSHLHLEPVGAPATVALAVATQTLLCVCGVDRKTSELAIGLSDSTPSSLRAFVGVHPSQALRNRSMKWLPRALQRASGLGEVGMDPKYSGIGPRSAQARALASQLEMAQVGRKPVQVHSRDAESACLDALEGFSLGSVLMHWFQSEEMLPRVKERGYFVSFGPAVIYSKKLQRLAASCDPTLVLAETDAPTPFTPLGGVHGASLLPSVVFKLAGLWGKRFEDARDLLVANSTRYLATPGKG